MNEEQKRLLRYVEITLQRAARHAERAQRLISLIGDRLDRFALYYRWVAILFRFLDRLERAVAAASERINMSRHVVQNLLSDNV